MYHVNFITLFPDEVNAFFCKGLFAKAIDNQLISFNVIDLRAFGVGAHKKVDDYPYSDKTGMLLRYDVMYDAISSIEDLDKYRIIYTCPQGQVLSQQFSLQCVTDVKGLIIIPGYFRGIDNRIFDSFNIERCSIGNFILHSGDLPGLCIVDSTLRLLPGVLGNAKSIEMDSFHSFWLESDQYTKPETYMNQEVPSLLLSGHHKHIKDYQKISSIKKTLFKRPDLLVNQSLTKEDCQKVTEAILSV